MEASRDAGRRRVPAGLLNAATLAGCLLVIAVALTLVGWLLMRRLLPVTIAVVAALLLAALLGPLTEALVRLRFPRWAAALSTLVLLLALVALPLVFVAQQAAAQLGGAGGSLGEGVGRLRKMLVDGPLPISQQQVDDLVRQARAAASAAVPSGAAMAAELLGAALLAIVLLFFLLKDGESMWRWLLRRMPRRRQPQLERAAAAGWSALTGYMRGTVIIAAVDAIGIGAALFILGVPLALPLALLTFVAAFVPIVGATVAGGAAVLVALVANGPTDALLVLAAVILVQQTEGNLLEPLVMSRAVRLHPVVILVVVAAGTVLAGVIGALVAVPVTAVAYRVISALDDDTGGDTDASGSADGAKAPAGDGAPVGTKAPAGDGVPVGTKAPAGDGAPRW